MAHDMEHNPADLPPPTPIVVTSICVVPLFRQEFFLRQKYEVEGLSARQIAGQIFSARSTVLKYLKQYNIRLRTEDESLQFDKGQLAYGERKLNGRIRYHKREQRIIKMAVKLRQQGHSYHKIAQVLNIRRIKTKNPGARWHATTVMGILKNGRDSQGNGPEN